MMLSHLRSLSLLLLCLSLPTSLLAGENDRLLNWAQWRGPLATGMAPEGDPPTKWDEKTNVRWKTALPGRGSSTPIVWGEQVFVLTALDTGRTADARDIPTPDPKFEKKTKPPTTYYQFVVLSYDRKTGKERWRQVATEQVPHEGHHDSHSYAAASPTTDGQFLYVSFGSRGVYCYDLDGKLQWKRDDLGRMQTRFGWGEGVAPVVHGDLLFVNWDQEANSFLLALETKTGKTRWKVWRAEPTSWTTPLVVEHKGKTQLVVGGTNKVRSYDPANGKVIWECGKMTINVIPSPVSAGGVVYCMSNYGDSVALALALDGTGDITGTDKVLWEYGQGAPYVPSPLLAGDRLYFTVGNNAFINCLDTKTGKVVFNGRLPGVKSFYASPVGAKDRLYFTSREGTTLVLRRSDKLEVLATNSLDDVMDGSPAVVGKQLFLRGAKNLYCLEEK